MIIILNNTNYMQAILGVLFHSLGGVAAGSFYMPYNKVKKWARY